MAAIARPVAIQVRAKENYDWLVKEVDFVSDGAAPAPPRRLLGPGFRQVADEDTGRLQIRQHRLCAILSI